MKLRLELSAEQTNELFFVGATNIKVVGAQKVWLDIGEWIITKYRRIAIERGTFHAAKLMRKQGVPVELAVSVLCGR